MKYLKEFEANSRQYTINISGITSKKISVPVEPVDSMLLFDAVRYLKISEIKKLLDKGADINIRNSAGRTLLISAVSVKNFKDKIIDVVKLLIDNGIDLNVQTHYGDTALMKAAKFRLYDVVYELIESGADWNFVNEDDEDVIELLSWYDDEEVEKLINKYPDKYEEYLTKKNASKYNI